MLRHSNSGGNKRMLGISSLFPLSAGPGTWGASRNLKGSSLNSVGVVDGVDSPGEDPGYIMQLVNDVRQVADVLLRLKESFLSEGAFWYYISLLELLWTASFLVHVWWCFSRWRSGLYLETGGLWRWSTSSVMFSWSSSCCNSYASMGVCWIEIILPVGQHSQLVIMSQATTKQIAAKI